MITKRKHGQYNTVPCSDGDPERIKVTMAVHKLPKDSVGGYRYNNAATFIQIV